MYDEDVMPYPDELKSSEVFEKQRADHALPQADGDPRPLDFTPDDYEPPAPTLTEDLE